MAKSGITISNRTDTCAYSPYPACIYTAGRRSDHVRFS